MIEIETTKESENTKKIKLLDKKNNKEAYFTIPSNRTEEFISFLEKIDKLKSIFKVK